MRFFSSFALSAVAFASVALAQLKITSAPTQAAGGKQYTIKWSGGDGSPATITLRKGASNDLKTITILTQSATGGSFIWNVDPGLVTDNDYALQITEGSETNYWAVSVSGNGTPAASTSTASSTSASSSTSSSGSSSTSNSSSITSSRTSSGSSSSSTSSSASSSGSSSSASTTGSSSSTSAAAATSAPSSGNAGNNLQSNAALVLGAMAGFAFLG